MRTNNWNFNWNFKKVDNTINTIADNTIVQLLMTII